MISPFLTTSGVFTVVYVALVLVPSFNLVTSTTGSLLIAGAFLLIFDTNF